MSETTEKDVTGIGEVEVRTGNDGINEMIEDVKEELESPYNLRPIIASDMGAICKIITAIGIRQFKDCFNPNFFKSASEIRKETIEKAKEEGLDETETRARVAEAIAREQDKAGLDIIFDIVGIITANYPKAEKEIHAFIASLTGIKAAEVEVLPVADFGELIMEIVMKEDFRDFFGRVMKLFNR